MPAVLCLSSCVSRRDFNVLAHATPPGLSIPRHASRAFSRGLSWCFQQQAQLTQNGLPPTASPPGLHTDTWSTSRSWRRPACACSTRTQQRRRAAAARCPAAAGWRQRQGRQRRRRRQRRCACCDGSFFAAQLHLLLCNSIAHEGTGAAWRASASVWPVHAVQPPVHVILVALHSDSALYLRLSGHVLMYVAEAVGVRCVLGEGQPDAGGGRCVPCMLRRPRPQPLGFGSFVRTKAAPLAACRSPPRTCWFCGAGRLLRCAPRSGCSASFCSAC